MNASRHIKLFPALFLSLLSLVLAGLSVSQEKSAQEPGPKIVLLPSTLDLGKVAQQTRKSFELVIVNEGSKNLVITEASASCGCTAAVISEKTIKPGGKGKVQVTFNSGSLSGTVEKSVLIASNDPKSPVKEFTFTAFVIPNK